MPSSVAFSRRGAVGPFTSSQVPRALRNLRDESPALAGRTGSVKYQLIVATTALPRLTRDGARAPVWRVVSNGHGEQRRALAALPKAR
ncbi:hypothetical protein OG594_23570 [Streptomyces sp. NBC_01214]|uniref:hypothetical protein n=1 Tax=Streptomyces sp. NBC_01214 TaxID=2903777 RepID=UPI00224DADE6|nr:hypothetical protein [Streptomyces sp. NBC_01214]MCX4804572.1 hypothetical protein [Streptomyces sp. NBC_01214]